MGNAQDKKKCTRRGNLMKKQCPVCVFCGALSRSLCESLGQVCLVDLLRLRCMFAVYQTLVWYAWTDQREWWRCPQRVCPIHQLEDGDDMKREQQEEVKAFVQTTGYFRILASGKEAERREERGSLYCVRVCVCRYTSCRPNFTNIFNSP